MSYTYEVAIEYIDSKQVETIKEMLRYGLWGTSEAKRKERPSTVSWQVSGDNPMTPKLALESRVKFTKQFSADGHRVKSIKFKQLQQVEEVL